METPAPEIVIPHDSARGPLTAVRRMLVHSSIDGLKQLGTYQRYCELIEPDSLAQIEALIGPGWMPAALALEHYEACDKLGLSEAQVYGAGLRAGESMGDALLVAAAQRSDPNDERSTWTLIGAFSRMGRRIYDGSSSQYVKLGSKELLIEYRDNPLFSARYYRVAHGAFMRKTFGTVGITIVDLKLSTYRSKGAEIDERIRWR
jgi:hypothetical protein